jgi:hypothetical protein
MVIAIKTMGNKNGKPTIAIPATTGDATTSPATIGTAGINKNLL